MFATLLGEGRDDHALEAPASLRLVTCTPATGEEHVVELSTAASSGALAIGSDGQPIVAFVEHRDGHVRLVIARPGAETSLGPDARIPDALDACASVHILYGPISKSEPDAVGAALSPDQRRCNLILADPVARPQAIEALDARCTKGEARACTLAGSFLSRFVIRLSFEATTSGSKIDTDTSRIFLPTAPERANDPRAPSLFARGCELGDSDACTRVLDAQSSSDAAKSDIARRECKNGNAFACDLRKAYGVQ
jgi:hypothetical protein